MISQPENTSLSKAINFLAKSYNTLDYPAELTSLLKSVYPSRNLENFSKHRLHKLVNDTLINNYNGEEILKYKLFECHINKRNIVAAFETKVNNSRVDFLTINGHTTSYEIKSCLDSLSKLKKQMADYMLAFEYNYLVVDCCHQEKVEALLPESYGLWIYENGKYKKRKKAQLNDKIDSKTQLSLLTKKELMEVFPETDCIHAILNNNSPTIINSLFKKTLKERYKSRWEFLLLNNHQILPIDIQFFFNTNIKPKHIYFH